MSGKNELEQQINTARTTENLEREAALRFGPRVQVWYEADFPMDKINAQDDFNIRIPVGAMVAGYKVETDLRNIEGMAEEIRAIRGITTPLVLSERSDGSYLLCQGYRRYHGAERIRKEEPGSPLSEKLQYLPCIVYKGLSEQQEKELLNDQKSKSFSKAEVFRYFREQLDGGFHWLNICSRIYPQIGQVTGNAEKVREIENTTDPKEREKKLREWLLSFVFQGWHNGVKSGPVVADLWMQTYLWQDGYKGIPRPRVVMDSNRMRKIWTAVLLDQKDGNFNLQSGHGPKLDEQLAKFEQEDNAAYDSVGKKKRKQRNLDEFVVRPAKEIGKMVEENTVNGKPNLYARILGIAKKDGGDPTAVRLIQNFDRCLMVYDEHKAYLKPEVTSLLDLIFGGVSGSEETFSAFLTDNYATPGIAVEPTPELVEAVGESVTVEATPELTQELATEPEVATEDGTVSLDEKPEHGKRKKSRHERQGRNG